MIDCKRLLIGRKFIYRRVGYDERPMTFLEGGLIGHGKDRCETYWEISEHDNSWKLEIRGRNRSITCELGWEDDNTWRGQWVVCEKMPVELRALTSLEHPRGVIIQQADGEFQGMLELTGERHAAYAKAHGFTYWQVRGELQIKRGPMWNKIPLFFQAFDIGFDLAIWLDADTVIADPSVSLLEARHEFQTIGMVKHSQSWGGLPWHFNAGVIFARNSENTRKFLQEVWSLGESEHPWGDQVRMMEVFRKYPDMVQEIDRKWNSQSNCNPCQTPVIRAWHGQKNRFFKMQKELRGMTADTSERGIDLISEDTAPDKYFHETGGGHYDQRFYNREVEPEKRCQILIRLLQELVSACERESISVILMHGALIGWYWNQKLLPWDSDIDVSIRLEEFSKLEKVAREGLRQGSRVLLEINPNYIDRKSRNRHFRENMDLNRIDARVIDVDTGLFIDITALASLEGGKRGTKCPHVYDEVDIFPLELTRLEGVEVCVPANVANVLTQEYGPQVLQNLHFAEHYFDSAAHEWVPCNKSVV